MQNCTIKYAVDLVFCIDGTRTMNDLGNDGQSILDTVKCVARSIGTDIYDIMSSRGQILEQLRARIIVFRDYLADGEHAMMVTDFFSIPQQVAEFEVCISSIHADGGGDIPEDGLEAMAYAIRSKWTAKGARRRQIILLWTDADAHDLGYGSKSRFYPKGMPANFRELSEWWDKLDTYSKSLVLFAPDKGNWKAISDSWDRVMHVPSTVASGFTEYIYREILSLCIEGD